MCSNLSVTYVNTFAEQIVQVSGTGTMLGISSKINNLGLIFDQTLSMQAHVNTIDKNCFYYLGNIARIRHLLSEEECRIMPQTDSIKYAGAKFWCSIGICSWVDSALFVH